MRGAKRRASINSDRVAVQVHREAAVFSSTQNVRPYTYGPTTGDSLKKFGRRFIQDAGPRDGIFGS